MNATAARSASAVLVYDGDCGICSRFVVSGIVRAARVRAVAFQALDGDPEALAASVRHGLDMRDFAAAMMLFVGPEAHAGHRAFNLLLARAGGTARVIALVLSFGPVAFVESVVYRLVAANRARISEFAGLRVCQRFPPDSRFTTTTPSASSEGE